MVSIITLNPSQTQKLEKMNSNTSSILIFYNKKGGGQLFFTLTFFTLISSGTSPVREPAQHVSLNISKAVPLSKAL